MYFGLLFSTAKVMYSFWQINGLGNFDDFFTNSSGHPSREARLFELFFRLCRCTQLIARLLKKFYILTRHNFIRSSRFLCPRVYIRWLGVTVLKHISLYHSSTSIIIDVNVLIHISLKNRNNVLLYIAYEFIAKAYNTIRMSVVNVSKVFWQWTIMHICILTIMHICIWTIMHICIWMCVRINLCLIFHAFFAYIPKVNFSGIFTVNFAARGKKSYNTLSDTTQVL
jgi:hypothetical protein